MAYEFKKLADVEAVETATDAANVLIEEGGSVKRVPKSDVGFKLPEGGTAGQVLTKTEDGEEWGDLPEVPEVDLSDYAKKDEVFSGSWNDLTDKPFGEERVTIVPETVLDSSSDENGYAQWLGYEVDLVEGETYTFVYNGQEELLECFYDGYSAYVGHVHVTDAVCSTANSTVGICAGDGGYFSDSKTGGLLVLGAEAKAGDTVALYKGNLVTLDPKYLPDTVAMKDDIPEVPEQVQSDWNENDETSAAYVRNRTHWAEEQKTELIRWEAECGYDQWLMVDALEEDRKYVVGFDGVEYEVTAYRTTYNDSVGYSLGNSSLAWTGDVDAGEPFFIHVVNGLNSDGSRSVFVLASDEAAHTVIVYTEPTELVHTLDPKYLPDSAKAQADWNENDETSAAFVKNRTHGVTVTKQHIVEPTTIPTTRFLASSDGHITIDNGEIYAVVVDGVDYSIEAKQLFYGTSANTLNYLGNPQLFSSEVTWGYDESDKAYPFCVAYSPVEGISKIAFDDENAHSIEVYQKTEAVLTLDPKFLPKAESVANVGDAPTAEQFNALLASLRAAGYLAE